MTRKVRIASMKRAGGDGEPREKKPRGHRHEDKEAKKVGESIGTTPA